MAHINKPTLRQIMKPDVHTVTLTPEVVDAINRLSQNATDFTGRSVSASAILRALVRQCVRQGPGAAMSLFLEVERELRDGVAWGNKKKE